MAKKLLEKGIEKRTAVLGAERVQSTLHEADDFNKPFQEAMTEWMNGSCICAAHNGLALPKRKFAR